MAKVMVSVLFWFVPLFHAVHAEEVILDTPGSGAWVVPAGVSSIIVEVWGAGGSGGRASVFWGSSAAGGGGGGAYARKTISVTPGQSIDYVVGAGGSNSSTGGDSWFLATNQLLAKGGSGVANNSAVAGIGGQSSESVGDIRFSGGNGANAATNQGGGGGGGGSAGPDSNGNSASNRIGGSAVAGGGAGGRGGNNGQSPTAGLFPGGGGGGAYCSGFFCGENGGSGADGQIRISYTGPILTCFNDDYNRAELGNDWVVSTFSGSFMPTASNARLLLTQDRNNQSTAATLQRIFPAENNLIVIELDHFAWSSASAAGGDGITVVFSDATVTPQAGSFGGSLGYAQRNNGDTGFAGGWLGIALDEYGNFSNPTEGRIGGVGLRPDSVTIRGSGNGTQGYRYLASQQVSGNIDQRTSAAGPGYRYRFTIDARNVGQTLVSVDRDIGSGYQTIIPLFNVAGLNNQAPIPQNLMLSFTGATGGSVNNHAIDNLQVCANKINNIGVLVDHFELNFPSQALTCGEQEVTVIACANASCSQRYTEPVSVTMSLGGQAVGIPQTIVGGSGTVRVRNTTAGTFQLGISGSSPSQRPFTQNLCRRDGGALSSTCNITFADSGFVVEVPDIVAGAGTSSALLKAVKKDDATKACVPGFANVNKRVALWSDYVDPDAVNRVANLTVSVNGTAVGTAEAAATPLDLNFNANGQAPLTVNYADAGLMQLNARLIPTGADAGLVMTGSGQFSSRPAGFCVQTAGSCSSPYENCGVFAAAGDDFNLQVQAVGFDADGDGNLCTGAQPTPSFRMNNLQLSSQLVAPAAGVNGVVSPASYNHSTAADNLNTPPVRQSEVGVFNFAVTPASNYFGYSIPAGVSRPTGRFVPARFGLSAANSGTIAPFCTATTAFAYSGQNLFWQVAPQVQITALNRQGITTQNYTQPGFMKLTATTVNAAVQAPLTDTAAQAVDGNLLPVSLVTQIGTLQPIAVNSGVLNYDFNAADVWRYEKSLNSKVAEFSPQLNLAVNGLQDADAVTGDPLNWQPAAPFTLRYGRLLLENAYGPETQPLTLPGRAEFWTGSRFVVNTADSCWAYSAALASPETSGLTTVTGNSGVLQQGQADMVALSAPGAGNTGTVRINYAAPVFLQDDFNNTGALENPSGLATFGIFRGHDRVIYWREVGR